MKIYKCDCCKYTFRYPLAPVSCPDFGKHEVRAADESEKKSYWHEQKILAEEVWMGLYAVTG